MIKASNNPFECAPVILTTGEVSYSEDFTYVNGQPQEFTVPNGITPKAVYHNRTKLFQDEYTVAGSLVTITYTTFEPSETNIITIEN